MAIVGIPSVMNGMDAFAKGLGINDNLMRQMLERRQLKQKTEHEKAALEQARMNHLENLAIQQQAQARLAKMMPYQIQAYNDAHAKADPNWEINRYKALEDFFKSQGANSGAQDSGLELMKAHPMLRGFYKKISGVDPLAPLPQTPQEKQDAALELFKQKESFKNANKGGEIATNKVLTQNQQAVQAIDTVLPMIHEFINNPDSVYGVRDFSPSKKASYNAKTGGMIDMLVAAQSLPQVKESVSLVEQQIRRGTGETVDAYIKRLKDFKKDLLARKKKAVGVVESKKIDTSVVTPQETKTLNGVTYEKINGEWHVAD